MEQLIQSFLTAKSMFGIIYCITNTVSGKQYVGQTTRTLERRWWFHLRSVRYGSQCALHCAIRKYSPAAFKIEQIDSAKTLDELNEKEAHHIAQLKTLAPCGYNLTTGGEGYEVSEEVRRIQSESSFWGKKTRCPKGHPYNEVNTYTSPSTGKRSCVICYYLYRGRKLPERFQSYAFSNVSA